MTDLEGISKKLLEKKTPNHIIIERLIQEYKTFKELPKDNLTSMANAILKESQNSMISIEENSILKNIIQIPESHVTMGEGGVGCRGRGDFFVHELLTKISETQIHPFIPPSSLDDTGAVKWYNNEDQDPIIILSKMEGMHSRLSDFPFLAGFHVTRAALRDIYVKGGIPISLMVDVHLADDGDIGKLFDFQAGIAVVAELSGVPITAGSTLRIGGDMVIGERLTGGIAGIGIMKYPFFRKNIQISDDILMIEGAGGGTIATTALYSNNPEYLMETININFLKASKCLLNSPNLCNSIHSMSDITNGGLRGDLYEICNEANCGFQIDLTKVKALVNPKILELLETNGVDYLGVSLDSLMIFCDPKISLDIINKLTSENIKISKIGHCIEEKEIFFESGTNKRKILPRFRESAYTEIKKVVDLHQINEDKIKNQIKSTFEKSMQKRNEIIQYIKNLE
ncbi:AIR synthase-related protein [Promethearchaeum syntrophicum]|uniref:AIR synthase-related protein n=1 Tax=Promethearchaeum syntrophicum TaxID=2594042 RepID=A0A5B9D9T7_9ARCH|nr:AIR synthase-related protein [Candidatus Prometheoarchaeum syntrophicum]QEE15979.1 thiamine monophosphate kinase [Candidatus Prometheoarchaeum syntrophicum]